MDHRDRKCVEGTWIQCDYLYGGNLRHQQDMYEAADVMVRENAEDSAYHTSGIKATIMILLILAIGGVLNTGYEQQLLMSNDAIFKLF